MDSNPSAGQLVHAADHVAGHAVAGAGRGVQRRLGAQIDRADWLGDLLYLPETLYCIGLAIVMLAGLGPWSVDAAIHARLPY